MPDKRDEIIENLISVLKRIAGELEGQKYISHDASLYYPLDLAYDAIAKAEADRALISS